MRYLPSAAGLAVGVLLGVIISVSTPASATRNAVGTYTLPGGNPVVSGTTISSSWANSTLQDIAVEITNSLDRQGRGAMLAPLRLQQGTAGAPALTFSGDPDTGLYRAGADDVRMQVDGAQSLQFTSAGTVTPGTATAGTLAVTGTSSFTGTASFTAPAAFNSGGPAAALKAGIADHTYLEFYADSDAPAVRSGYTGYGGAGTTEFSVVNMMTGGNIRLVTPGQVVSEAPVRLASANPAAATAFTNTVTPKNVIKAWARVDTAGGGSTTATVVDGFNVASASVSAQTLTLTLASAFANTNYAVLVTPSTSLLACGAIFSSTTQVLVTCRDISGSTLPFPFANFQTGAARSVHVAILGAQ
ncbi:putative tail fiber protein [Myxococcus phage Mx9]|nr:putative tail fiber protein [Myxococcus phage Mx9]